jgi:hypothetical protein
MFTESEIPWDDLAFQTVRTTLRHFYADRAAGVNLFTPSLIPHLTDLKPVK